MVSAPALDATFEICRVPTPEAEALVIVSRF
jgi:hypothetical protein